MFDGTWMFIYSTAVFFLSFLVCVAMFNKQLLFDRPMVVKMDKGNAAKPEKSLPSGLQSIGPSLNLSNMADSYGRHGGFDFMHCVLTFGTCLSMMNAETWKIWWALLRHYHWDKTMHFVRTLLAQCQLLRYYDSPVSKPVHSLLRQQLVRRVKEWKQRRRFPIFCEEHAW